MARKRKANIPKTSVRGKKLKDEVTEPEKVASTNFVETTVSLGLKYDNLGNYQEKNKSEQKKVEPSKYNINRKPLDGTTNSPQVNKAWKNYFDQHT